MPEYYISRKRHVFNEFEVAKFDDMTGGEQPLAVYTVKYNPETGKGRCNCPAAAYRGTGSEDKHVKMVAKWIQEGGDKEVVS